MAKKSILGAALFIGSLELVYLRLSPPGRLVVDEDNQVLGLSNHFRKAVQGRIFWEDQFLEAQKRLESEISEPKRLADEERYFGREMEQLYQDYPDMRPTADEKRVVALRDQADEIEDAELRRDIERWRHEEITRLRNIKRAIKNYLAEGPYL